MPDRFDGLAGLDGLQAWMPTEPDLLGGSPLLRSIPRQGGHLGYGLGRLSLTARASRRSPAHDITRQMVPRLLAEITKATLEGNPEMPQESLVAGRAHGKSIAEALQEAFAAAQRHGSRTSTLVVHPSMMDRVYRELAVDPARFSTEGEISIQGSHGEVSVMPDRFLPEGTAYLVDPSQLRMQHVGVHPITASARVDPAADEIEVRLAYAAQVVAHSHAAIMKLILESQDKPDVTNNVLPERRTAWDRIIDDSYLGEAA